MATRKLKSKEYNNIKAIFNILDTEKDGELEFDEFSDNMRNIFKLTLSEKDTQMLL